MASPMRALAVDAEDGLRRVGEAAADLGDVAQADGAPVGDEVDVLHVALGVEGARDAQDEALVAGLEDAGRQHQVLRLQLARAAPGRSSPRPASCSVENSMKICSSCAPSSSILATSGTCSSRERAASA